MRPRRRLPQRSEAEVHRLVLEHRSLVEWTVSRYLCQHSLLGAEREDLVSWGLIGLLAAARAFDPGRARQFSTLAVVSIERQVIRGARRARRGQASLVSFDAPPSAAGTGGPSWESVPDERSDRELARVERSALLREAMDQLSPDQRALIQSHFFQGRSLTDLACEAGLPYYTLANRLRAALRVLRANLEDAWAP
ncbi:MAG: sigma-70 family RNA polymerase sigma factor [Armatimonadota bacterium]